MAAVAPPPPEEERQWERIAAVSAILGLFILAVGMKLYLSYQTGDKAAIDSVILMLSGFLSSVMLYLGFKLQNGR